MVFLKFSVDLPFPVFRETSGKLKKTDKWYKKIKVERREEERGKEEKEGTLSRRKKERLVN